MIPYELNIEIWENEAAFKAGMESTEREYVDMAQVTVKKLSDGRLLTFWNQNDNEEVAEIIKTFQAIK